MARKCGKCRQPGHNARSCQNNPPQLQLPFSFGEIRGYQGNRNHKQPIKCEPREAMVIDENDHISYGDLQLREEEGYLRPQASRSTLDLINNRVRDARLPPIAIPSRGRSQCGQFFEMPGLEHPPLVLVIVESEEAKHYRSRLRDHILVILPRRYHKRGVPMARDCAKTMMEALSARFGFGWYFMIDDDVKSFKVYLEDATRFMFSREEQMAKALERMYQVACSDPNISVLSAQAARCQMGAIYEKKAQYSHVTTSKCEKVVLLNVERTRHVGYVRREDRLMTNAEWQYHIDYVERKLPGFHAKKRRYFQGEDFNLCLQLKQDNKLTSYQMARLIVEDLDLPSQAGTINNNAVEQAPLDKNERFEIEFKVESWANELFGDLFDVNVVSAAA